MTRISDLLAAGPTLSFEFFPPSTDAGRAQLERCIDELAPVRPSFVSVTYGAGGSTRTTTRDLVLGIDKSQPYPAMPHLTCIGHRRDEIDELVDAYAGAGIDNILALAGDPPADGTRPVGDFTYAEELVEVVRAHGAFSVGVAAFPEGHPRSEDLASDRLHLARKLGGADFAISQFFFRAESYFRLRDDLARLGCERPVLPGVMPLLNPTAVARFAALNGAWFPDELASRVDAAGPDGGFEVAVEAAIALVDELVAGGVPGVHLYALNRSDAALAIIDGVGWGDGPPDSDSR